jgi:hypothetical protein
MNVTAECYAGYRGEETPRRFWMGNRKIEVAEVLDQWLSPGHRYFKILGDDNSVYILRHDPERWRWELSFYTSHVSSDMVRGIT